MIVSHSQGYVAYGLVLKVWPMDQQYRNYLEFIRDAEFQASSQIDPEKTLSLGMQSFNLIPGSQLFVQCCIPAKGWLLGSVLKMLGEWMNK